jgi:hypothetical protein
MTSRNLAIALVRAFAIAIVCLLGKNKGLCKSLNDAQKSYLGVPFKL